MIKKDDKSHALVKLTDDNEVNVAYNGFVQNSFKMRDFSSDIASKQTVVDEEVCLDSEKPEVVDSSSIQVNENREELKNKSENRSYIEVRSMQSYSSKVWSEFKRYMKEFKPKNK